MLQVVTEIQFTNHGATVKTKDGSIYMAKYVISSVSLGVLQSDLLKFNPPLLVNTHRLPNSGYIASTPEYVTRKPRTVSHLIDARAQMLHSFTPVTDSLSGNDGFMGIGTNRWQEQSPLQCQGSFVLEGGHSLTAGTTSW